MRGIRGLGGHGFSRAESASERWALAPEAFSQYCVEIGQNGEGGPYLTARLNTAVSYKKMRPPLGIGGLGECVSLSVSFSHRRVGSSILASLSEAGGNEFRKVASKPLPPRSPLFSTRHVKRTHASL